MTGTPQLPSVVKAGSLTANVHQSVHKELSTFVDNGILTPEQQTKLTTAISSATALASVATPAGRRHLASIDTMLSIRHNTAIGRARDSLVQLSEGWADMRTTWHQHRQAFYDVKLRTVQIRAKRAKATASQDDMERELLNAEADLEQAQLDSMQSDLSEAVTKMHARVEGLNKSAASYALVCKEAGKETFTDADFQEDEIKTYVSMAVWHAAHGFQSLSKRVSPTQVLHRTILPRDALAFFKAIGVSEKKIQDDLAALANDRAAFAMAHGNQVQSYADRFDQWTMRIADKYYPAALRLVTAYGMERFRRAASIMSPDPKDIGTGDTTWSVDDRQGAFQ